MGVCVFYQNSLNLTNNTHYYGNTVSVLTSHNTLRLLGVSSFVFSHFCYGLFHTMEYLCGFQGLIYYVHNL